MPYYGCSLGGTLGGAGIHLKTTARLEGWWPRRGTYVRGLRACVALITVTLLLGACGGSARPESADQPPAVSRNADPPSTSRPAARHPAPAKPISVIPKLYAVRTEARAVALTFDDGPDPRNTPQILDLLARYHVHATFFVLGSAAKHYPGIVRRSAAGGNEIGNHGWTHLHIYPLPISGLG
jgi:hypothetical protein